MIKPKVLFLCTGNSVRSQMAEAFLRYYAGGRFEIFSAGLAPGGVDPDTIRVMEEIGIDMSNHRSKSLGEYPGRVHFSYLITVCSHAKQNCPVLPGMGVRLHWSVEDPGAGSGSQEERLAKFRQVRDEINERVCAWAAQTQAGEA